MNGFVVVDMLNGQNVFSMMMQEGFGIAGLQGSGPVDESTVAAHFAGMSFSLMLQAMQLTRGGMEGSTAASRGAYFAELRSNDTLADAAPNAAPMRQMETVEGTSLCFYLHPDLPLLCAVSSSSDTLHLCSRVAEGVVKLLIRSGHAEGYFVSGSLGAKKLRKALSAPTKDMYQSLLIEDLERRCNQQIGGGAQWELMLALDPTNGMIAEEDVLVLCLGTQRDTAPQLANLLDHVQLMPASSGVDRVHTIVARDAHGACSVVLRRGTAAAMLRVAPAPRTTEPIPADVAALHCSWAEGEFPLWTRLLQFAHANKLNVVSRACD